MLYLYQDSPGCWDYVYTAKQALAYWT